jgi:hypothetical protein
VAVTGLSVCCLTAERPAMVARMLGELRPVAAEIVVAVDARGDPSAMGPLLDVADTVVRFEYRAAPERARPWLVDSCHHPWVLMVDGDEVPSAALVRLLPSLVAPSSDPRLEQVRIARRWCFPDERHFLAERPWWPDFQRRLVRRGPQLDFDLGVHGGVRDAVPARYVTEPLYHLACVLRRFPDRRRRVREYEAARPGIVAVGGGPMNDTLYVPEHFATRRPEPAPDEDVDLLRDVLTATEPRPTSRHVPVVGAAEIAAHVPTDPLAGQGYRARLAVVEADRRTDPGRDTHLLVAVTNTGPAPIPWEDGPGVQVRIATRVIGPDGAADWTRTPLPCGIAPGDSRLVEALVRVPHVAGRYDVEIDLLNERARWFDCAIRTDLAVATRWGRYAL